MEERLLLKGLKKSYEHPAGTGRCQVLEDISLTVEKGELVSLVGPSGCGKSTLLRIIAGFESADIGHVEFGSAQIDGPSPERGMVFQSPVLFPWLNVRDNIAYGLRIKKVAPESIWKRCDRYMALIGLSDKGEYFPRQLSGGMQQRVALARVLVLEPRLLLLDEPFAALDAPTRMSMQQLLLEVVEKLELTSLLVTHDIEEALFLADKVYVMASSPGKIICEKKLNFARPRGLDLFGNREFSTLRSEVLQMLLPASPRWREEITG